MSNKKFGITNEAYFCGTHPDIYDSLQVNIPLNKTASAMFLCNKW